MAAISSEVEHIEPTHIHKELNIIIVNTEFTIMGINARMNISHECISVPNDFGFEVRKNKKNIGEPFPWEALYTKAKCQYRTESNFKFVSVEHFFVPKYYLYEIIRSLANEGNFNNTLRS